MAKHVFITFFTGTKYDNLDIILTQLIHHVCNQIEALLVSQSGYDTDQHRLVILLQPHIRLQGTFILNLLFPEVHCIITVRDVRICLRIERIIVNTVQNTTQVIRTCTEQSVQTFAIKRRLDLFCIGRAYGCNRIRIYQTAF